MSVLFSPLTLRGVTFRNRIFVSPMCQYTAVDGVANDWHLVHYGSRAVGGAGLVMAEATAVTPKARISPGDLGLWSEKHIEAFSRITAFIKAQGAVPGIQLAHAGRKASAGIPWRDGGPVGGGQGGWTPEAPSAVPFDEGWPVPEDLPPARIRAMAGRFAEAAERAWRAGFEVVEIHMAHGYLLHEFLSPLSNRRTDDYGGHLDNRMRFPLLVAAAVREAWPADKPVFARLSVTDWIENGWDPDQSVEFARRLKALGIDLLDCSSGGLVPNAKAPAAPGYQVPFAERIRREAGLPTGAVGLITDPAQAEAILAEGRADAILMARQFLREPYWPLRAAHELGAEIPWPPQYLRARP